MDWFLDRLQGNSSTGDSNEAASDSDASEPVEWRNISIRSGPSGRPTAADSTASRESAEPAPVGTDTDGGLEALGSGRLLTTVLDTLSTPAVVTDSDGGIEYLNAPACRLFDTTDSAAVGRPSTTLHDGAALVPRVVSSGETVQDHRETVTISGTRYNLSRTVAPFTTESGDIVGAMEIVRSWTE